jgi:hypothetical protein
MGNAILFERAVQCFALRSVENRRPGTQEEIFQRLSTRLTPECRKDLDSLLEAGGDHHPRSALLRLKEYPPEATAATIRAFERRSRCSCKARKRSDR